MLSDNNDGQPGPPGPPEGWTQLTPEQKRQRRLDAFLHPEGIDFISPEEKILRKKSPI